MSHQLQDRHEQSCYKDYLELPEDKKYEIIDGVLFAMTPSLATEHQRVLRKLFVHLANFLTGKDCEVLCSPYDVLLPEGGEKTEDVKTVVQPDILVVCDKTKLTDKHCIGAPDLIIEIVSPSSPSMDYVKKLNLYEKHRVGEYWIVNYIRKQVMVYRLLTSGEYGEPEIYMEGMVNSEVLQNFAVNLQDIFN